MRPTCAPTRHRKRSASSRRLTAGSMPVPATTSGAPGQPDVCGEQRRRPDVRGAVRDDRRAHHADGAGIAAAAARGRQGDKYNRILFAAPADPDRRRYLTIRSSFDEGKTWQSVADGTRITSDWSGYSDMAILDTGEIGLPYEGGAVDARDQIRFARFTENDIGHPDAPLGTTTPTSPGSATTATSVAGRPRSPGSSARPVTSTGSTTRSSCRSRSRSRSARGTSPRWRGPGTARVRRTRRSSGATGSTSSPSSGCAPNRGTAGSAA